MQDGISLPHLPREVVVRIFERLPILSFLGGAVATCRKFSLKWYLERSFQKVVVVPDEGEKHQRGDEPSCQGRRCRPGSGFGPSRPLLGNGPRDAELLCAGLRA